jgi:hypothetical protein
MATPPSILTYLSDINSNPKLNHYNPHLCKDIHIKLDQEAREEGLSYEERFEMVYRRRTSSSPIMNSFISGKEKSNCF